jgi:hypothetical protein
MARGLNIYDEALIQGRLWNPNVLNPYIWVDADDLSTIVQSAGGGVSAWVNKGSKGGQYGQNTAGARPIYLESGWNGMPCLSFNGSTFVSISSVDSPAWTVFTVYRNTTPVNGYRGVAAFGGQSPSRGFLLLARNGTGLISSFSSTDMSSSAAYATGIKQVVGLLDNNDGTSLFRYQGANAGSFANANPSGQEVNHIGGQISSGQGNPMLFCEMIVLGRYDESTIVDIEGYLAWKWDVPLNSSHPFANRPPLIGD